MLSRVIRRLIHEHPRLLHKPLVALRRGRWPREFPTRGHDVFVSGFPRSANSFLARMTQRVYPELQVAHHVHTVGSIRLADRLRIPMLLTFRNPMDSVASWLHMQAVHQGKRSSTDASAVGWQPWVATLLDQYVRYHRVVAERIAVDRMSGQAWRILLVPFEFAIGSTAEVPQRIEALPITAIDRSTASDTRAERMTAFLDDVAHFRSTRTDHSHTGDTKDETFRQQLTDAVAGHPLFPHAETEFARLVEQEVAQPAELGDRPQRNH